MTDDTRLRARSVLIATGVVYRQLDVPNFSDFDDAGIYYAATDMECRLCRGEEVVVVGGGNSAGQAIVRLASYARQVHVVVRKPGLGGSMSRYLVERIESMKNVIIHRECTVSALEGNGRLAAVDISDRSGGVRRLETSALFLFIGADANSQWLRGCVDLDRNGFVLTGPDLPAGTSENERWRAIGRSPFLLETSLPGVFAAGDVRSGSVKRCASAVGEGSMAVNLVHQHIGPAVVAA